VVLLVSGTRDGSGYMILMFKRMRVPSIPIYNISGLSGYQFLLVSSLDFFPRRTFETFKSPRAEYVGYVRYEPIPPKGKKEGRKEEGGGREVTMRHNEGSSQNSLGDPSERNATTRFLTT
jgi:hypothetical protein